MQLFYFYVIHDSSPLEIEGKLSGIFSHQKVVYFHLIYRGIYHNITLKTFNHKIFGKEKYNKNVSISI